LPYPSRGADKKKSHEAFFEDLRRLKRKGIKLVLLQNALCYGDKTTSDRFLKHLIQTVGQLHDDFNVGTVTTSSPLIAKLLKLHYSNTLEVRASVQMGIGRIDTLPYLSDYFDGFYVQRELYRDIDYLYLMKEWAQRNEKKIYALVNSGCFAFCPWHVIHNNALAHLQTVPYIKDGTEVTSCLAYLRSKQDIVSVLKSDFIRPEAIGLYADIFDGMKLATRVHPWPRAVVKAYTKRRFRGILTDLLEPGYTGFFPNKGIYNELFPADWNERTSHCRRRCHTCRYCFKVSQIVVRPIHKRVSWSPGL
jgi:hypothetical protein